MCRGDRTIAPDDHVPHKKLLHIKYKGGGGKLHRTPIINCETMNKLKILNNIMSYKDICWGNLHRVPWATGYNLKDIGYDQFPPAING
jgi:hypothetical protein